MLIVRVILVGVFAFLAGFFSLAQAQEELTWQDCLQEAAKNNPDLIAAQEDIVQAQASRSITASDRFPHISADVDVSTSHSDSGSTKFFQYGVSGTQLVFDGFNIANSVRAATENIQAAREGFRFASTDVRFRLRTAFISLLKAQELLKLTQEIYTIRKNNMELIALRYESGTEHKGALLTAQANFSQASYEINQAQRGTETAQKELIKELGRTGFSPIAVKGDFQVNGRVFQKPDLDALVKDHPSLLRLTAQRNAASFDVKANQGDYWPTVSLNAGTAQSEDRWPPRDSSTSAGLSVSLPLFEGGARAARVAQARSVYRQREQQERSGRDEIVVALDEMWNELQDAVESVKVQQDFLNAAQARSQISEQQYAVGLISFDNWIIIEDELVRNKKSFLDAQANALLAEANWVQAKGETLEYEK